MPAKCFRHPNILATHVMNLGDFFDLDTPICNDCYKLLQKEIKRNNPIFSKVIIKSIPPQN